MADRPRDPRMPHVTRSDPRSGFRPASGVLGVTVAGIAYAVGGPVAAAAAFAGFVVLGAAWYAWRGRNPE